MINKVTVSLLLNWTNGRLPSIFIYFYLNKNCCNVGIKRHIFIKQINMWCSWLDVTSFCQLFSKINGRTKVFFGVPRLSEVGQRRGIPDYRGYRSKEWGATAAEPFSEILQPMLPSTDTSSSGDVALNDELGYLYLLIVLHDVLIPIPQIQADDSSP